MDRDQYSRPQYPSDFERIFGRHDESLPESSACIDWEKRNFYGRSLGSILPQGFEVARLSSNENAQVAMVQDVIVDAHAGCGLRRHNFDLYARRKSSRGAPLKHLGTRKTGSGGPSPHRIRRDDNGRVLLVRIANQRGWLPMVESPVSP